MKLLRSYLFAPGNNQTLTRKVFSGGADAVVLDLEDAVPEAEKAEARRCVAAVLENSSRGPAISPTVFVRLNSLESAHWRADVDAVMGPAVFGVRVPKAENIDLFCRLNDALSDRERALGLAQGSFRVIATIESAWGLARVDDIARAPRLEGLTFGAADFCADVGADPIDDDATLFARSALVATSRSRRLAPPIASVFTRLTDDDGLRVDTDRQRRLGFFGRSAIHPRQVPIIHAAFKPSLDAVTSAQAVIAAYELAQREGRGATRSDGGFIDIAVLRQARATLELHDRQEAEQKARSDSR